MVQKLKKLRFSSKTAWRTRSVRAALYRTWSVRRVRPEWVLPMRIRRRTNAKAALVPVQALGKALGRQVGDQVLCTAYVVRLGLARGI